MKIRRALLFLLLVNVGFGAFGQTSAGQRQAAAGESIRTLKDGVLVVRLSSGSRKIESLEKLIARTTNEKDRLRYQVMLEKTVQETRNQNLWLMEAFEKNYRFSKVLFMSDTASVQLKSGTRQGIFLNNDLQTDPALSLEGNFRTAWYGENPTSGKSGEGITVADAQWQDLPEPFPFFTGRSSVRRMFEEFFNKATDQEHFAKLVTKFNQRLQAFYGESIAKGY